MVTQPLRVGIGKVNDNYWIYNEIIVKFMADSISYHAVWVRSHQFTSDGNPAACIHSNIMSDSIPA